MPYRSLIKINKRRRYVSNVFCLMRYFIDSDPPVRSFACTRMQLIVYKGTHKYVSATPVHCNSRIIHDLPYAVTTLVLL